MGLDACNSKCGKSSSCRIRIRIGQASGLPQAAVNRDASDRMHCDIDMVDEVSPQIRRKLSKAVAKEERSSLAC